MEDLIIEPTKLQKVKRIIDKYIESDLKDCDLSRMESFYLNALLNDNGLSLSDLTKQVCFDKANTTRIVGSLEKKGYIERKNDETDSRKYKIFTTEKAENVKKKVLSSRLKFNQIMFNNISDEEKKVFKNIVKKIVKNLTSFEAKK